MTLADRLVATRGRPTGFDYLRIVLAISVVAWHTVVTCYGLDFQQAVWGGPFRPLMGSILPMFFALSGFLVAGSLERTPELAKFLGLRILRIIPALAVETLMSALLLGPALTIYPLNKCFSDIEFREYLLNVFGVIHMHLPGLWLSNPFPNIVNAQLWTVPFELECYALLALLAFLGIAQRRNTIFWTALALQLALFTAKLIISHGHEGGALHGRVLVMTFLAGVAIYAQRQRVLLSPYLFAACLVASIITLAIPMAEYLSPYPVAYVTVYLGLTNFKANALHRMGDLSYGIFLYGFPIQQLVESWGPWTHHWYVNLALSLPLVAAVALVSWRLVEKRCLELKRHLIFLRPIDVALEKIKGAGAAGARRIQIAYPNVGWRLAGKAALTGAEDRH